MTSNRPKGFGTVTLLAIALAAASDLRAEPRHGISAFGDLKYKADFQHFDYVNPNAPKGGRLSQVGPVAIRTFDSFNPYILKGNAAQGMGLIFESLMTPAADEPDSVYGLVAESADIAADKRSVTFRIRPQARFSDGSAISASDVVFSFNILREKGRPSYRITMRDVVKVEALDEQTVRYQFKGEQLRDLPLIVASLPILSKAYYATQPFEETSLKPPLGSGPYKISEFKQGTFITYKRRADYWGKDLAVNRGRHNFDEIRFEYFRDRTTELEALKAGVFDLREEFTARDWVTGYDIPAVKDRRLLKVTLPDENPSGAQGFFMNTRRAQFQDIRVRRAFDYAFDYEWTNNNLFYGLYTRTESFFENSDMKAVGKPSPEELALLEPFRDKLAPEVFDEPYRPPTTRGTGNDRRNLREAQKLLAAAGWKLHRVQVDDTDCGLLCRFVTSIGLRSAKTEAYVYNDKGETLDVEFLTYEPTSERLIAPYRANLRAIGIRAEIRRVDSAQYEQRVKTYDFDIVTSRFVMGLTPGIELQNYWGTESANMEGSRNLAGIRDPVIDALIEKLAAAHSREELVTATRAIDRVLRAGHYWVPHWYKAAHHVVYWNKFSRPVVKPKYDRGILDTWWYDDQKAATLNTN